MTEQQLRNEYERTGLRWLVVFRSALVGVALLATFIWGVASPQISASMTQLSVLLAIVLTFSVASLWWKGEHTLVVYTQLSVDVLLVTGAIYLSGGATSPFLFLYFFPVIAGAFLISRRAALMATCLGVVTYSLLVVALTKGIIPPAWGDSTVDLPSGGLSLQLVGLLSGMILVAVLTSYLSMKLRMSAALLEESKRQLLASTQNSQTLVEGLPTAVITVSLEGQISALNGAALSLLGMSQEGALGKMLSSVLRESGMWEEIKDLIGREGSIEGEFQTVSREDPLLVSILSKPVLDASGTVSGTILVLNDITRLRLAEGRLETQEKLARLLSEKRTPVQERATKLENFVGDSPVMGKVFNLITRVAPTDATVLISGESGTGKELVARAIHLGSERATRAFVPVNCGAIPENLIESELFGHKKGAFTGADSDHTGLFRQADGGTIFLDEIGELPLQMQTKLLRTIQQKSVRPVGGDRDIPTNVRIVAATNRNLKRETEQARFREDLYYRLNVININLPPLRDRKGDIPLLVSATLKRILKGGGMPVIPPATMELLEQYNYPGNVRELENILERAVVLGGEVILPEHLPENVRHRTSQNTLHTGQTTEIIISDAVEFPVRLDDVLGGIERRYLECALVRTNGARKKAADLLGINFRSFRYRLQKFGIHDGDDEA